jgi:dehydrogenase/reductase SDR family protein 7B
MLLKDKVVIITGATSGIGLSCAEKCAMEGAKLVITGRNRDRMNKIQAKLTELGAEHLGMILDSGIEEDNRKLIDETIKKFGKIDILINNAGISMRALFQDLDLRVFRRIMDTNFYGTVYATKFALPYILESKGVIVGISSINGHRGTPARTAYSASKYAMEGFFEALRTEIMYKDVHVLVVSPGFTQSNIRNQALDKDGKPQGESPRDESKMMTSQEVAEAIFKGIFRKKRDIFLTPSGKAMVFFNKWIPRIMDYVTYNVLAKEKDSPLKQ